MSGITSAAFGQLRKKADATAFDHEVTRKRVDNLEAYSDQVSRFLTRPLWGRLRWLLLGR